MDCKQCQFESRTVMMVEEGFGQADMRRYLESDSSSLDLAGFHWQGSCWISLAGVGNGHWTMILDSYSHHHLKTRLKNDPN